MLVGAGRARVARQRWCNVAAGPSREAKRKWDREWALAARERLCPSVLALWPPTSVLPACARGVCARRRVDM